MKDLDIEIKIKNKGKIILKEFFKFSADVLQYKKERVYGLAHSFENIVNKLVTKLCEIYDKNKEENDK